MYADEDMFSHIKVELEKLQALVIKPIID